MKVVFNSREREAPCTVFYQDAFSSLDEITLYDLKDIERYDIALFMTYRSDLEDLKKYKTLYPNLKTAIIDPRGSWVDPYLQYADFLVLDSLEMRDFWAYCDKPVFEYVEYPDIGMLKKNHERKEKIILGYHGNKIHLETMCERITPALEKLGNTYNIELWTMYNIEMLGRWEKGVPNNIPVKHIQWSETNYHDVLSKVDIGLNPCFMPIEREYTKKKVWFGRKKKEIKSSPDDYILRFKMPSNPGRIIVFGLLGIPVVSDFIPSAMQCIRDGVNGYLAYSTGGWYKAIKKLIANHTLRQELADNMQNAIKQRYDFHMQNNKFMDFLKAEIL